MIEDWKNCHVRSIHCTETVFRDSPKMKVQYIFELDVFDIVFFCCCNNTKLTRLEFKKKR